jgi:ArsR family metal-binding transcriptional regulator
MDEKETGNFPVINGRLTSITEYSPLLVCLGDPAKFRIVARLSPFPEDILTKMGSLFEKAIYSKKIDALLIRRESTIITVYSSGIVTMTRLKNEEQSRQILQDIIDSINNALMTGTGDEIRRVHGIRRQIDPMEINSHLPHSNCGKCGFKSCLFFATMIAFSEAGLERCTPLFEDQYAAGRDAVAELISSKSSG